MPNQAKNNIYIHGTGSGNLPLLEKTEFTFFPMSDLVKEYHSAPLIAAADNGLSGAYNRGAQQAFGKLFSPHYGFHSVLKGYASRIWSVSEIYDRDAIFKMVENSCNTRLVNILYTTVRILQMRQMGCLENLLEQDLINIESRLQKARKDVLKRWTLFYIVVRYVRKADSYKIALDQEQDTEHLFRNFLYNDLYSIIPDNFLQRSDEEKKDCFSKLMWPSYICYSDKQFELQEMVEDVASWEMPYSFSTMLLCPSRDEVIFSAINKDFFKTTKGQLDYYAKIICEADTNLKRVIAGLMAGLSDPKLEWTAEQKSWVTDSFPIIVRLEDDSLLKSVGYEWRAIQPLKIGKEIKFIYTSSQHVKKLQNFFNQNKINVSICDFETLYPIQLEMAHDYRVLNQAWCYAQKQQIANAQMDKVEIDEQVKKIALNLPDSFWTVFNQLIDTYSLSRSNCQFEESQMFRMNFFYINQVFKNVLENGEKNSLLSELIKTLKQKLFDVEINTDLCKQDVKKYDALILEKDILNNVLNVLQEKNENVLTSLSFFRSSTKEKKWFSSNPHHTKQSTSSSNKF